MEPVSGFSEEISNITTNHLSGSIPRAVRRASNASVDSFSGSPAPKKRRSECDCADAKAKQAAISLIQEMDEDDALAYNRKHHDRRKSMTFEMKTDKVAAKPFEEHALKIFEGTVNPVIPIPEAEQEYPPGMIHYQKREPGFDHFLHGRELNTYNPKKLYDKVQELKGLPQRGYFDDIPVVHFCDVHSLDINESLFNQYKQNDNLVEILAEEVKTRKIQASGMIAILKQHLRDLFFLDEQVKQVIEYLLTHVKENFFLTRLLKYIETLTQIKKLNQATRLISFLTMFFPKSRLLTIVRGDYMMRLGFYSEAKKLFNSTLKQDPSNFYVKSMLAECLLIDGDRDEALNHILEVAGRIPNCIYNNTLWGVAVSFRNSRLDSLLTQCVEKYPNYRYARTWKAMLHLHIKEPELAYMEFNTLLQMNPQFIYARQCMEKILREDNANSRLI